MLFAAPKPPLLLKQKKGRQSLGAKHQPSPLEQRERKESHPSTHGYRGRLIMLMFWVYPSSSNQLIFFCHQLFPTGSQDPNFNLDTADFTCACLLCGKRMVREYHTIKGHIASNHQGCSLDEYLAKCGIGTPSTHTSSTASASEDATAAAGSSRDLASSATTQVPPMPGSRRVLSSISCPWCTARFRNLRSLRDHSKSVHMKGKKSIKLFLRKNCTSSLVMFAS